MTNDQAIYRTASEMVRMSGFSIAKEEAAKFADELIARDDEGRKVWLRVVSAIEELERSRAVH